MDEYMIVITPKDEIKIEPFSDFKDVQKVVHGTADTVLVERYHLKKAEKSIIYHMFCNDDFMAIPNIDYKPNALVSMLYNQLIIGNVVMVKLIDIPDGFTNDGFSWEEASELQDDLLKLKDNQFVELTMSFIRKENGVE